MRGGGSACFGRLAARILTNQRRLAGLPLRVRLKFFDMTTGPNPAPDGELLPGAAVESICPVCGGPRYRGPFGDACPRCLLAAGAEPPAGEGGESAQPGGVESAHAERERRFDRFEVALRPDGSWWEIHHDALGATYRAVDIETLAPLALRVVDFTGSRDAIFQQAMQVSRLRHPHIARLVHFGSLANGRIIIVAEPAEGRPLSECVRESGAMPSPIILEIAAQVALALIAADEHRIQHGNLSPASIVLGDGNDPARRNVIVREFGVASWFGRMDRDFVCPERLAGQKTDARSDFYSLGTIVYFALSGIVPMVDATVGRVHFTPLRKAGVPEEVIAGLRRLLAINPAGRPKDAYALVDLIESLRVRSPLGDGTPRAMERADTTRWWRHWLGGGGS